MNLKEKLEVVWYTLIWDLFGNETNLWIPCKRKKTLVRENEDGGR